MIARIRDFFGPIAPWYLAMIVAVSVGYTVRAAAHPESVPSECTVMASTAAEIFGLWDDLTGAVNDRGDALDKDTYAIHDAEVNHVLASLDAVEVEYIDAENACLGDS